MNRLVAAPLLSASYDQPVADRVERITELLMLLLDTQHPVTFDHIVGQTSLYNDRGESSRKSFERDKSLLRHLGIDITTEIDPSSGATRYTIKPEDYFLPDLDLTESERLALQLAASVVRLDEAWDEQAVAKLGGEGATPPLVVAEIPALEALPVLHGAMRTKNSVRFEYSGRSRIVNCYSVFYRDGNWYMTGNDDGTVKTFRVDRIDGDVAPQDDTSYELPVDFDPTATMPRDPLLIGGDESVEARVWIDPALAGRVVRQRGIDNVVERNDDGSVVVNVPVRNHHAFRSWVLGLREHAVVLSPDDLRAEVVDWLRALAEVS
jgi:predicted DNA-binding transcriptional regulator YafY